MIDCLFHPYLFRSRHLRNIDIVAQKTDGHMAPITQLERTREFSKMFHGDITTLGIGAFAAVILVKGEDNDVAIKCPTSVCDSFTSGWDCEVVREVALYSLIAHHPNVLELIDVRLNLFEGRIAILLKPWQRSLNTHIKAHETCGDAACRLQETLSFAKQMCKGVAHLHRYCIVHRDIKPDNVLVDPDTSQLCVCDLGHATICREGFCLTLDTGTPSYKAPEVQANMQYGLKADVYSLGCVFVEIVTKKPLYPYTLTPKAVLEHMHLWTPSEKDMVMRTVLSIPETLSYLSVDPDQRPALVDLFPVTRMSEPMRGAASCAMECAMTLSKTRRRILLVAWIIEVCHAYDLSDAQLERTVQLIDAVCRQMDVAVDRLQTLGLAALGLATRLESRVALTTEELSSLSDNASSTQDIDEWEMIIMRVLEYHIACPLPHSKRTFGWRRVLFDLWLFCPRRDDYPAQTLIEMDSVACDNMKILPSRWNHASFLLSSPHSASCSHNKLRLSEWWREWNAIKHVLKMRHTSEQVARVYTLLMEDDDDK